MITWICTQCSKATKVEIVKIRRFMRHGTTEMNLRNLCIGSIDEPLNEFGRQQAIQSAQHFLETGNKPEIIVSSPMKRAMQTAEILSHCFQVSIAVDSRLRERRMGAIEGKPETPESDAQLLRYDFLPNGAESLVSFEIETLDFITEIASNEYRDMLLITHGFRMLTIIKLIKNMSAEAMVHY